jgi:phospholipase C
MSTSNCFPIEHLIVLMLENRSYEHILGHVPNGHGLASDEFNLVDPSDPTSDQVRVSNRSGYITAVDRAHDFVNVETEMFGEPGPGEPEEMRHHRALLT